MIKFSEYMFNNSKYRHYIARYEGEGLKDIDKEDFAVTMLNSRYVIITCENTISFEELRTKVKNRVIFIEKSNLYSLESISPIEAAGITQVQNIESLGLDGEGVLVGMIDTGINYLNEEFKDDEGNTRIVGIWDQNIIDKDKINKGEVSIPYGTYYTQSEINEAINSYNTKGNYKKIVPSVDTNGHGTKLAGIIAARGENPMLKGAAPKANLVCVKLNEDIGYKEELDIKIPIYNLTAVFSAVDFLSKYAIKEDKPMVIYLPMGSTFGNHTGGTLLERFIDDISINKGIIVVTGTGNEGDAKGHTSGSIKTIGKSKDIMLYIDPLQKSIQLQIWVRKPNVMSINIISPSGEESGVIPAVLDFVEKTKFIFENTQVNISYYLPDLNSGDELIELYFKNIQSGTWKFRLIGDYILDGRFDAWIGQRGVTKGRTQFTYSDPYGTLTSPGPSYYIVNVANYDQTTNYIVNSSGRAFENDSADRIDIAAGGVNVMTTSVDGKDYSVVNGTCVSAAVVAGACALLLQWGIVKGNSPDMYAQKIKSLLVRGVEQRVGDIYPNTEFGYGILNMLKLFINLA